MLKFKGVRGNNFLPKVVKDFGHQQYEIWFRPCRTRLGSNEKKTEHFFKAALVASCDIILETLGVHCWHGSEKRILGRDQFQKLGSSLNNSDDKSTDFLSMLHSKRTHELKACKFAPNQQLHHQNSDTRSHCHVACGQIFRHPLVSNYRLTFPWTRPFREVERCRRGSTPAGAASPLGRSRAP